jgi:hypothetical protein
MTDFTRIPEALDFIACQSWLAPDAPDQPAQTDRSPRRKPVPAKIGLPEAIRQIATIIRQIRWV